MIARELMMFCIVGSLTVLLDFTIYSGLVFTQLVDVDLAKALGFIAGTVFAYFANRFWTFGETVESSSARFPEQSTRGIFRFILLYASTCIINVLVNATMLFILTGVAFAGLVAFLFATGMSAGLNFLGMKLFAFNGPKTTAEPRLNNRVIQESRNDEQGQIFIDNPLL